MVTATVIPDRVTDVVCAMSVGRWLSFSVRLCVLGRIIYVNIFSGRLRPSSARSASALCVSRNMKQGELGRASAVSEPLAFTVGEKQENLPPFPTIDTYDGKVWKYIPKDGKKDILFWNVGAEPVLKDDTIYTKINSYRDWAKNADN